MNRRLALLIALAMAVTLAASGCGGKKQPAGGGAGQEIPAASTAAYDEAMAEATAAVKAGDYEQAVAGFERALAARPGDTEAQAGLDQAEQARDKVNKAAAVLGYARQISPQIKRLVALNPTFEHFSRSGEVADLFGKQRQVADIRSKLADIASGLDSDLAFLNAELIGVVDRYERGLTAMGQGGSAGDLSVTGAIKRDYDAAREGLRRFAVSLAEYAARFDGDVAEVEKLIPAD